MNNHLFVNGSKIEESGFSYNYPELTAEVLREVSFFLLVICSLFERRVHSSRSLKLTSGECN